MADTKKVLAQVPAGSATTGSSLLGVDSGTIKRFPITALANLLYPVGSYYWSSNPTDPGTLFGGTWEQIKDRFILAAGGTYAVNATGGEASHVLSVNEMPSHSHSASSGSAGNHNHSASTGSAGNHLHAIEIKGTADEMAGASLTANGPFINRGIVSGGWRYTQENGNHSHSVTVNANGAHSHTISVSATGGSAAHNNMPPYIVAYCWHRTA